MILQIIIGLGVMVLSGLLHSFFVSTALSHHSRLTSWARNHEKNWPKTLAISLSTVWVMSAHIAIACIWCTIYLTVGAFKTFEETAYFTFVAYTTLGFGDLVAPVDWRFLSGLTAANGLLAFGWSTAFQVDYLSNLRRK